MGSIKFSQLPIATDVAADDYYAVLDTSENILKRAVVSHASEHSTYGLGTAEKYGHNKVIDDLGTTHLRSGEALSARQGNVIAKNLGQIEATTTAEFAHQIDDCFMFMGQFVHCIDTIDVGDTINIGTNVEVTSVGDTFIEFQKSFQDGVGLLYETCAQEGVIPSESSPQGIAQAIVDISGQTSGGDAEAGDILQNKTAYVNKQLVTGTMPDKGSLTMTLKPDGNNTKSAPIEAGYYTGGTITADGTASYQAGDSAGYTRGYQVGDSAGYTRGKAEGKSEGTKQGYNEGVVAEHDVARDALSDNAGYYFGKTQEDTLQIANYCSGRTGNTWTSANQSYVETQLLQIEQRWTTHITDINNGGYYPSDYPRS